jgi:hypothetical protein
VDAQQGANGAVAHTLLNQSKDVGAKLFLIGIA